MKLCRIRFDGYHYLAQPYVNKIKEIINTEDVINDDTFLSYDKETTKRDIFVSEWYLDNKNKIKKNKRNKLSDHKKDLMEEFKKYYYLAKENFNKEKQIIQFIYDSITSQADLIQKYSIREDDEDVLILELIKEFVNREKENLKARKQLFRRKALNNDWNYFVTFTYDDKKHTEESFLKTLKKKLQNLHTNYDWLYMGCFERSKTGRLHFHGLIYVPEGTMRGNIRKEEYFDTNSHKKATSYINEEFENKIGRNDFKEISKNDFTFFNALEYILKYIGKSDNKIVYSRGIKDDFFSVIDFDNAAICRLNENSPYYVLADISMLELDKKLNTL